MLAGQSLAFGIFFQLISAGLMGPRFDDAAQLIGGGIALTGKENEGHHGGAKNAGGNGEQNAHAEIVESGEKGGRKEDAQHGELKDLHVTYPTMRPSTPLGRRDDAWGKVFTVRAIAFILFIAVWIYGIILASLSDEAKMPGGLRKGLWLAFTIIIPGIGSAIFAVSYLLANDPTRPAPGARPARRGPLAPDDDPEFLARLDDELRRQHYERELRKHEDDEEDEDK